MERPREQILEARMRDLLRPRCDIDDQPTLSGLELIDAEGAVNLSILGLIINRNPHHFQKALDRITNLQKLIENYQIHLDPE